MNRSCLQCSVAIADDELCILEIHPEGYRLAHPTHSSFTGFPSGVLVLTAIQHEQIVDEAHSRVTEPDLP